MDSYGEGPHGNLKSPPAFGLLNLQIPLGVGLECGGGQHQVNSTRVHQEEFPPPWPTPVRDSRPVPNRFGRQGWELVAGVEVEQHLSQGGPWRRLARRAPYFDMTSILQQGGPLYG
ncbi:unnamed protein product [Arctogadus glacialis]